MLAIILLWAVIYLSGLLFCKLGGEKETSRLWVHLTGFFFLFFSQGFVFIPAQLLGWSFTAASDILAVVYLIISLLSLVLCLKDIRADINKLKNIRKKEFSLGRYLNLIIWLFVGLLWVILIYEGQGRSDAVAETAATTVYTNSMNMFHPMTHAPLETGIILSKKIITLPFWYAAVSRWTGIPVVTTVQVAGTAFCLLFSFLAFARLGNLLFEGDNRKTSLLIVFMELLCLSGDYYRGADGYRKLYYGYSGEMIVAEVIIPVIITTLYCLLGKVLRKDFGEQNEGISLWGAILKSGMGIVASLFITSFIWGALTIILAIIIFLLSVLGSKLIKSRKESWNDE